MGVGAKKRLNLSFYIALSLYEKYKKRNINTLTESALSSIDDFDEGFDLDGAVERELSISGSTPCCQFLPESDSGNSEYGVPFQIGRDVHVIARAPACVMLSK